MAIVQKGGMPDLAPLVAGPVVPPLPISAHPDAIVATYEQGMRDAQSRPPAPPPPRPRSIREDIVVPHEPPPVPTLAPIQPLPPPPLPLPPQPPSPPARPAEMSPIHTYAEDFSQHVRETGASRVSILAAAQDARRTPTHEAPPAKGRGARSVLAGAVLLVVGAGALYIAYARYSAQTGPVTLMPTVSAPISVDERETVAGTGGSLMLAFEQAVGRPLPSGAVRLVYNPNATTTDASLFNQFELPAPGTLLRNIDAAGSMAGVVSVAGAQSPFFILSVSSYSTTFAAMLAWEPSMTRALSALFPPYTESVPLPVVATSTATTDVLLATTTPPTATSSASTKKPAPALSRPVVLPVSDEGFADEVVANHDTRVYRDRAGRSVLIYGYWDQTTLVIARDEAAFTAILSRLATARSR